jgi:hypothetical protein
MISQTNKSTVRFKKNEKFEIYRSRCYFAEDNTYAEMGFSIYIWEGRPVAVAKRRVDHIKSELTMTQTSPVIAPPLTAGGKIYKINQKLCSRPIGIYTPACPQQPKARAKRSANFRHGVLHPK